MSFLSRLCGGNKEPAPEPPAPVSEHRDFTIRATPYQHEGQWQMCGVIEKDVDGALKSHRFVRADRFASRDDAIELTFSKARQIIDQQGDALFR